MKVAVYATVEISDEQRKKIGGGQPATREEIKAHLEEHLQAWDSDAPEAEDDDQLALEDLI